MYLVCIDAYSLEAGDIGRYRTPCARFVHRSLAAAERHRRKLIRHHRDYPTARLFYIARLVEGERVAP